jgi:hypothetical protein
MLYMFHTYVARLCLKCFSCFSLVGVFVLQVAIVLSGCCICFTHMSRIYVPNVSSASDLCCIQVFHVTSVSCFRCIFKELWGHGPSAGERTRRVRGRRMGRVVRLGSCGRGMLILTRLSGPTCAEREEGVRGKAGWARDRVRVHGRTRQTKKVYNNTVGVRHISAGLFLTVR